MLVAAVLPYDATSQSPLFSSPWDFTRSRGGVGWGREESSATTELNLICKSSGPLPLFSCASDSLPQSSFTVHRWKVSQGIVTLLGVPSVKYALQAFGPTCAFCPFLSLCFTHTYTHTFTRPGPSPSFTPLSLSSLWFLLTTSLMRRPTRVAHPKPLFLPG